MTRVKITLSIGLAVVLALSLVLMACSAPAPSPTPKPAPAPTQAAPKTTAPSPTAAPKPIASPAPSPKPTAAPKPAFKMPSPLVSSALDVGSQGYVIAVAIADAMQKEKGVTMRIVPVGTDVGRTSLLASGRAHVLFQGFGAYAAQEGVQGFDAQELGPQPLQVISAGAPTAASLSVTAKDANIKTWADIKGKRVAYIDGYPAVNVHSDMSIAFAGLTWNDVTRVKFTSFGAMGRGIIEGTVDVATGSTTSAYMYELMSSPRGLQWVPYPHSNTEGWKKMVALMPIYTKTFSTTGAGLSKDNPLETGTYPNPHLITSATADPELVYQMTKLMVELYPVYGKAQAPGIDQFDPQRLIFNYAMPYNEGAMRYYKEIGKWTAEAQKNNDLLLKRQQVLKAAWDEALAEAAAKKIASANYPKFWLELRDQRLTAAGLDPYFK